MGKVRSFFTNKEGQVVIFQTPNLPLLLYVACLVLSKLLPSPGAQQLFSWLGAGSLVVWAMLEIFAGSSWFRRLLGLVVLLVVLYSRFTNIMPG